MKSVTDYLPLKSKDQIMVQGRVPAQIWKQVKDVMSRENLSWAAVLTASLRRFLDEVKPKQAPKQPQ